MNGYPAAQPGRTMQGAAGLRNMAWQSALNTRRQAAQPRTDAERRKRHRELFGTGRLPARGTRRGITQT